MCSVKSSTKLPCIILPQLITGFYMYSSYTQCVVKTILTMVLYAFSKYCLTTLTSMQYKILHSCREYFHSSFILWKWKYIPVFMRHSPIVRAHFLALKLLAALNCQSLDPGCIRGKQGGQARGEGKTNGRHSGHCSLRECSVHGRTCWGTTSPRSDVSCQSRLVSWQCPLEEEYVREKCYWWSAGVWRKRGKGKGKVRHKKLAFKCQHGMLMLSFFHQFLATWLSQSTY